MNSCQLIGQLYDPDCQNRIYYDGRGGKTPRLDFVLAVDRPYSGSKGVGTTQVRCNIGGEPALWFISNVKHGDVVALDGFVDCRILAFANNNKVDMRVVVVHINWVGKRKTQEMVAGTEKINLGDAGVTENKVEPQKQIAVCQVPEEDDDGRYDTLPDWNGGIFK